MDVPPAAGAIVMGTGIVSIGLELDGEPALSSALLALAVLVWLALVAALLFALGRRRRRVREHARTPAALTAVAATAVLGGRLAIIGWNVEAAVLLALAVAAWVVLVPGVTRNWRTPTVGASFLLAVATESVAVLASRLGANERDTWLAAGGIGFYALGILLYAAVLARFELKELRAGRGDQWIAGGALAIAALAGARAAQAAAATHPLHPLAHVLDTAAFATWVAAIAWLPVLLAAELVARRPAYDLQRWATVFPVGMYAVCSFADGGVRHIPALQSFARVWIWVAFAVWLAASAGALRRAVIRSS